MNPLPARTRALLVMLGSLAILVLGSLALAGCRKSDDAAGAGAAPGAKVTLVLASYTTPREAYGKAVLPAFAKRWREEHGQEIEFHESYQGSGAQSRAVTGGFEADVVALSLEA